MCVKSYAWSCTIRPTDPGTQNVMMCDVTYAGEYVFVSSVCVACLPVLFVAGIIDEWRDTKRSKLLPLTSFVRLNSRTSLRAFDVGEPVHEG